MGSKNINLSIPLSSLDLPQEVITEYEVELLRNAEKYNSNELSLDDFSNFDSGIDLDDALDASQKCH